MSEYTGIYEALIRDLTDPLGVGRARLIVPSVMGEATTTWAQPLMGALNTVNTNIGDRAWVLFEQGDINKPTWIATTSVPDPPVLPVVTGVIPGEMKAWPAAAIPSGYLLCDGGQYPIATYPDLYNVLTANGTVFPHGANTNGSGVAGSTHFRTPDGRGRMLLGVGTATGAVGATAHTLGQKGGEETHLLTAAESGTRAHTHTLLDPGHAHQQAVDSSYNAAPGGVAGLYADNNTGNSRVVAGLVTGTSTTGATINNATATSASASHNLLNPYLGINWIIKT